MAIFFVSWQLWEEMTFVLAMSIVLVFFLGIGKLYWRSRHMRKHEVLDAEKQARLSEIRKSGLARGRKAGEIPFGVRAIQGGVEVEGIWISRPMMGNAEGRGSAADAVFLPGHEERRKHRRGKGKGNVVDQAVQAVEPAEHGLEHKERGRRRGRGRTAPAEIDNVREGDIMDGHASSPLMSDADGTREKQASPKVNTKENTSFLDRDDAPGDSWTSKDDLSVGEIDDEQAKKLKQTEKRIEKKPRQLQAARGKTPRPLKNMTSLEGREEQEKKWKLGGEIGGGDPSSSFEGTSEEGPMPSPSTIDSFIRPYSDEVPDTPTPLAAPQSKGQASFHQRIRSVLSEETLRQLDVQTSKSRKPRVETYVPTTQIHSPSELLDPHRQSSQTSSASATESFMTSEENFGTNTSGSQQSAAMSRAPSSSGGVLQHGHYVPQSHRFSQSQADRFSSTERGPFGAEFDTPPSTTPLLAPVADKLLKSSRRDGGSLGQSRTQPQTQQRDVSAQMNPTSAASDVHGNPNKRRGDSGFESLQVGTFGIASTGAFALAARDRGPANFENSTESQGGRRELRKKSISEEQESQ